jgi:outer membrane protein TolC
MCSVAITAQDTITLEKCRELALENSKSAAIAARNKDKAAYTRKAYRANYFPKISASGSYLYTNLRVTEKIREAYLPTFVPNPVTGGLSPNVIAGPDGNPIIGPDGNPFFREYAYFPGMDFSLKLNNFWMAGLSAEQPIYTGGKITAAYRMAQTGDEIADLSRQLARQETIVQADEAYWTFVQTSEMLKVARSYREMLDELLRNVQDAEKAGLKHRNDVLKVQVKMNEAELKLRQAENGMLFSQKNLCRVMGLPFDIEVTLPASFGDYEFASPYCVPDYSSRPEYAMLEKQVTLKDQEIKLVRSDFLPRADVVAGYGYTSGLMLNDRRLFDRASFSVMASVSIPVFHWGEGRNKIRAAKAERAIARLQREDINEQMALELERAQDKCDESELEVELTVRSLEQAEENMNVSALQYKSGMETLSGYLEAHTAWQKASMEHVGALARRRLNHTYYLKASGEL